MMALTREGWDGAGAADEGRRPTPLPPPGLGANRQSPMKGPPVGLVRQTVTTDGRGWSP
ncbi:hypothetical protein SAMN04488563_3097 [Jiangella alkaliphila]|uniref:Uncharacterized protein n=1 Tax=Jiangella alkaliphila TaxID=419479 RepID=A0A1H2JUP3_9ACTN|nr:hypothetical protein SAMN04488563_3097 [Jiangella alkaliphila]